MAPYSPILFRSEIDIYGELNALDNEKTTII